MKKTVIKGIVFVLTFLASLFLIGAVANQGNTDMTVEMGEATFPLIYMELDGEPVNCLHGYREPMDTANLRETVTPLSEGRGLAFRMQKFGAVIRGLSFEVRSTDGGRLIENTPLSDYTEQDDQIFCRFSVKDLIEPEEEYLLVLLAETDGGTLRYYTRILQGEGYHAAEKLAFVRSFHQKTFDKKAAEDLTIYLESSAEGDNSSYSRVDIHSSFQQITWGGLHPQIVGTEILDLKDLSEQTAVCKMTYPVRLSEGGQEWLFRVEEFYRIRYTEERMYLLDFERTMNQLLDEEGDIFFNDKIYLGIVRPDLELEESDGGSVFAFVSEDRLYSYNAADNTFAVLYGFYDRAHFDERTLYNESDIRILNVEETGDVRFLVYGYMNRGRHEGEVGVQVLRYSALLNTVEEEVFLPYHDACDILRRDVERLSYIGQTDRLYLMLEGTIYSIALQEKTYEVIADGLGQDQLQVSGSGRMIAWQDGEDRYHAPSLQFMNLNTGSRSTIEAGSGRWILPLGFMGEDLIYGIARDVDVYQDSSGRTVFPMKTVQIENENNQVLKRYQQSDIYVMGCEIDQNQITLRRVRRSEETGELIPETDDQIMNSEAAKTGSNVLEDAVTERYETVMQIAVKGSGSMQNVKIQTPREVLFEGGRQIALQSDRSGPARYYVYGMDGVADIETDAAAAIRKAEALSGVVTGPNGYVWRRGGRSVRNQIMAIEGTQMTEQKNALAVCLDTILNYEGTPRNTENMLSDGQSVVSILQSQMPGADVLDLTGCSLDSVLYFVDQDIPVLAMLPEGDAVLLVGFNELNTVWMDPRTGTVYKVGMNSSAAAFEEAGNQFVTYIRARE